MNTGLNNNLHLLQGPGREPLNVPNDPFLFQYLDMKFDSFSRFVISLISLTFEAFGMWFFQDILIGFYWYYCLALTVLSWVIFLVVYLFSPIVRKRIWKQGRQLIGQGRRPVEGLPNLA